MPCALEMFMAVCCAASIWPMLSALRHAEAAKPRAAVLNIVAVYKEANNVEQEKLYNCSRDDAIQCSAHGRINALPPDVATANIPAPHEWLSLPRG